VAAATLLPVIAGHVDLRVDAGAISRCGDGESGCVRFEVGDVNALAAEVFTDAHADFIGSRCEGSPVTVERDEFGRMVRAGTACEGLSAGALTVAAVNLLRLDRTAFALDALNPFDSTMWNQPAFRYTVHALEPLREAEAANLVAFGTPSGERTEYEANADAAGFVRVELAIHWAARSSAPNLVPVTGMDRGGEIRFSAILELDRDPADPDAEIVGGEYLDEGGGESRLDHRPFAWRARGPGSGDRHNPYVDAGTVERIVELASRH
jgi:hypothetical protein